MKFEKGKKYLNGIAEIKVTEVRGKMVYYRRKNGANICSRELQEDSISVFIKDASGVIFRPFVQNGFPSVLNLYKVSRLDVIAHDEFEAHVIAAAGVYEAIQLAKSKATYFEKWDNVDVLQIGNAIRTEPGIILSSFNAG